MMTELSTECSIAVFGTLRRHHWISAQPDNVDAYGLVDAYSELLGFRLDSNQSSGSGSTSGSDWLRGHWVTVAAGGDWSDGVRESPGHILWAEVSLPAPPSTFGAPISPLTFITEKCLSRVGYADVHAVQMMVPLDYSSMAQPSGHILFATAKPKNLVVLEVEIVGSADGGLSSLSRELIDEANARLEYDDVAFESPHFAAQTSTLLEEPNQINRAMSTGSDASTVRTTIAVPELSLEFASYLTSHLTLAGQIVGVSGSIFLTLRLRSTS